MPTWRDAPGFDAPQTYDMPYLHPVSRARPRVVVTRIAAGVVLCSLAACTTLSTSSARPNLAPWPEIRSDFRTEALRVRMHEYSITFAAEVDLAAASIERRAPDAVTRRNAVLWRLRAIPEMRKACFRLEPVGALIDAWVLARQMDQLFREGAGAGAFGPLQPEAVAVSHRLVEQMRHIGGSISVSPEARARFEQNVIDPWLGAHPLPDLTFTRDSPITAVAEQARTSGDVLQSVATMEELAFTVSQQVRLYLADLPRQVRGEIDLMRADMFPDDLAALQDDLHVSAAAAARLAATAEAVAPLVLSERRIVLGEMNMQRELVMEALSLERERAVGAFVRAFAAERGALLRAFETQRLATLDWATAERSAVVAELRRELAGAMAAVRDERVIVVDDVRRVVDAVLLRVALFLVAAVVLAPAVAHAYARVWPRRTHGPVDAVRAGR